MLQILGEILHYFAMLWRVINEAALRLEPTVLSAAGSAAGTPAGPRAFALAFA